MVRRGRLAMKRSLIGASMLGWLILSYPVAADAQRVTAMGMRGTVNSASVAVPAEGEAAVYTTPADRPFVLTQACFDAGGMVLSGSSFGVIPSDMGMCTTYHPGIAVPRSETLRCQNPNGVVANCMVTGVVTR